MKRIQVYAWLIFGLLLLLGTERQALSAQSALSGAGELTSELLKNQNYLLNDAEKTALDEINRQIREAEQQNRRAASEADKRNLQTQLDRAAQKLPDILAKCTDLIRISIRDIKLSVSLQEFYSLPCDKGAMLLRVDSGEGETFFKTILFNLADGSNRIPVSELSPKGVTWILVSFENVPKNRTSLVVDFQYSDGRSVKWPMDIKTPTPGLLKVNILAEETGKPTPAMVRLVWKKNGTDRKPGNAIEFAPQFDRQGNASGHRSTNLPGKLGGYYWCVPGPFTMELPAGEWEITIRRGVEHRLITDTFSLPPGGKVEKTYTIPRWVDMRNLGWFSGDDHVHCQILGDDDAQRLMSWVQAEDIHLANVVKMGDIYRTWFEQRGFGKEYRVIDGDYILSPGQECPRTHDEIGHTLAMNIKDMVRDTDKYYLYDTVFDTVHAQGGLSGYAHVLSEMFFVHRDMSINIPKSKVDFVELMQFGSLGTKLYYEFLNTGFKITASAGSDVPWGGSIGEVRLYGYIGNTPFTADAWFDAIKRGRTFVTNGPMIEFQVNRALPGDEIHINKNEKLQVHARAWADPQRMNLKSLEIVQQGDVLRNVIPSGDHPAEVNLDFEIESGGGFWIAARAEGSDGSKAHTTPIYVIRDPLRFWKLDAVEDLISKRLANLEEVEKIVADARDNMDEANIQGNRAKVQLALQGPELLKRVADARKIYENLKQVVGQERKTRADLK